MLKRSRVGTIPDLTRLSHGVARPGIDPRINCSRAEALTESTIDKEHGHYVDVQLLPSGLEMTCRVPQEYSGKDFGSHEGVIKEGDELYVMLPEGDPSLGPIVIARIWSEKYAPPELVEKNPKDIVRVVEKDIAQRLLMQGEKGLIDAEMSSTIDLRMLTDKAKLTIKIGDFEVIIDNTASPTKAHFKTDDGDVFKLTKDGLELGKDHDDKMALAKKTKDEIKALRDAVNTFKTTYDSHTHTIPSGTVKTSGSPVAQTQNAPATVPAPNEAGPSIPTVNDVNSTFVKSN